MPLQATSGAASYDAFGGGVAAVPTYIEDVFSTYLYTGNDSTQTITNGIDLSTKGGLVWQKSRNTTAGYQHVLYDTVRGSTSALFSSLSNGAVTSGGTYTTTFNTTGFTTDTSGSNINQSGFNQVSWTFRKQPKFFDVVTYSGNSSTRTISHSLASAPGMIIIKRTTDLSDWWVWHRTFSANEYVMLNSTAAKASGANSFISSDSTGFTIGSESNINGSGNSYVAYLFAHDAGGFGLTGTDNVISCGSYTGNGSSTGPVIDLGYEPQWLLIKKADSATTNTGWAMFDNMRGLRNSGGVFLYANSSAAEDSSVNIVSALATGFQPVQSGFLTNGNGSTYIYIAIRRGPMKVPTSGTSVFEPEIYTGNNGSATTVNPNIVFDLMIGKSRNTANGSKFIDRLRGLDCQVLDSAQSTAESPEPDQVTALGQTSITYGAGEAVFNQSSSVDYVNLFFQRAPSFFDEVCYTGTGSATTVTHNLGVVPELMLFKRRDTAAKWEFYFAGLGNTQAVQMPDNDVVTSTAFFNNTSPTSSIFTVNTSSTVNASGGTYVAYLAASCAGVSKIGTYTGTGSTQTINCGFASGARFVLIKNVGVNAYAYGFYVWDTARGMVVGTDPSLQLDSTAAEVNANSVYTTTGGFQIVSTAAGINGNGDQFVYWAIA